jgi:hypothetical protein
MPYIKRERRNEFYDVQAGALRVGITDAGELNYIITQMVRRFLASEGTPPRYADFNAAIGALECCKLELYRRMIAPYEDKKIAENGDVY